MWATCIVQLKLFSIKDLTIPSTDSDKTSKLRSFNALTTQLRQAKKAIVSALFHVEVDEKNPVLETFVWDLQNGHNE